MEWTWQEKSNKGQWRTNKAKVNVTQIWNLHSTSSSKSSCEVCRGNTSLCAGGRDRQQIYTAIVAGSNAYCECGQTSYNMENKTRQTQNVQQKKLNQLFSQFCININHF